MEAGAALGVFCLGFGFEANEVAFGLCEAVAEVVAGFCAASLKLGHVSFRLN
jgi:hypothetical protein